MNSYRDIFAGLFGGATSAILLLAANMGGSLSLFLFLLVTFPIYVVTLSWGTRAAIASTVGAIAILLAVTGPVDAISFTLMFFSIAAVLGHQANLAQDHPLVPGQLYWYPIPRLLFNLSWMVVVAILIAGYLNNYTPERLQEAYYQLLQEVLALSNSPAPWTPEELKATAKLYAGMMPFVLPALLIVVHVINLHLAASISRRSGQFKRPKDDLPASVTLPVVSVGAMAIGLTGPVLFSGIAAQSLTVLAGGAVTSLALVGLASLHFQLRGKPAAPLILFLVYAACLIFMLPFYLFSIVGIVRVSTGQKRANGGGNSPNPPNPPGPSGPGGPPNSNQS